MREEDMMVKTAKKNVKPIPPTRLLYSKDEAAQLLSVSKRTIYNLLAAFLPAGSVAGA